MNPEGYNPSPEEVRKAEQSLSPSQADLSKDREVIMGGDRREWSRHGLNIHPTADALLAYKNLKVVVPKEMHGQFEARGVLEDHNVVMHWRELQLHGKIRSLEKEIEVDGTKLTGADIENYWAKYGDGVRLLAYENLEGQGGYSS